MARTLSGAGNYLSRGATSAPSAGSILLRIKPAWNSGDSTSHPFFMYFTTSTVIPAIDVQKNADNNIYAGFINTAQDARVVVSDAGLFSSGSWVTIILDWDDAANLHHLYVNNVLKGTSTVAFAMTGFDEFRVGTDPAASLSANADVAELARVDHVLTADERALYQDGWRPNILSGVLAYVPILGTDSPEPDIVGTFDLTVNGSCPQATHPTLKDPVTPPLIASTAQVFEPTILSPGVPIEPEFIASTAQVFAPAIDTIIFPAFIASGAQVFEPTIPGTEFIFPSFLGSTATVY